MEKLKHRKTKWMMIIVLITHLLCFFPSEMIPLPVFVVESELITGFFDYSFTIIPKFIIIGQIVGILFLILRYTKLTLFLSLIAPIFLASGNLIWIIAEDISINSFEFYTNIPFFFSVIALWILSVKNIVIKLKTTNNRVYNQ